MKKGFSSFDAGILDVNSHEFTLSALRDLYKNDERLFRKINWVKSSTTIRFIVATGVVCYLYSTLNERLKVLERNN